MKNKNKLLLSLLASLAVASTGHAQKNDAPELSPLSVVGSNADAPTLSSGLKSSLPISSIPQSISVMGSDQMKAQGMKSIGDVLDFTPGVINSQGEGHRDAPIIRGVRTTQDLYRNGVRDDVQYYRPLYNVERVEVLRGPNALLSGFGGAYGMINRVTKSGVVGEDFTTLGASIDTFGEHSVQLDKNMQLDDKTALRVNIFGENLSNHRDYYYGEGFGINPTLTYDLGDGDSLKISYEYLDQERFIDRGIPTDASGNPVEAYSDIVFGDSSENFSTHEANIIDLVYEHEISDSLTGRFAGSHSDHDKLYQNFYVPNSYAGGDGYLDGNTSTVALDGYKDTTQRKTSTLSYQIDGEFEFGSIVHNIIAGIEYLEVSNDNDRYNAVWDPNNNGDSDTAIFAISTLASNGLHGGSGEGNTSTVTNTYSSLNDRTFADIDVLSFYLSDEIALMDSLDLVLGVRFDSIDFDVVDADDGSDTLNDSEDTVSPRVGLIFDATEALAFYASYSESFTPKAGDQYAKLDSNADKVDPDTFENTEIGLRFDLPMGLSLSAAYFEIEKNAPNYVDATTTTMETSDISGFELALIGTLTDNWFLSAAYTNLDAETDGTRLKETPESVFSIFNNYLVNDRLALSLGILHQDESHITNGSTAMLPDYTRVDVGASYLLSENTRVQLNVENVTDEVYFPHAHGTHQASVGAPINAMLSITSSF
ncbi:MAG TPA: TonB-dependent siderophore receptor [Opitutae bacterium]|nr:TonB-dependent siderophore receptor [Opitutae bacterium]HCY57799.1 TonB-dependent siderophore receptor [Opitutae bacterium]|tara:strand:+ start:1455 stop:3578 length:2124 start_codon:yes stop_codon:yes gene_type:complete